MRLIVPTVRVRALTHDRDREVIDAMERELNGTMDDACASTLSETSCFAIELCVNGSPRIDPRSLVDARRRGGMCFVAETAEHPFAGVLVVQPMSVSEVPSEYHHRDLPGAMIVHTLCSAAFARNQGVAKQLLDAAERACPTTTYLNVLQPWNTAVDAAVQRQLSERADALLRMYRKRGYEVVRRNSTHLLLRRAVDRGAVVVVDDAYRSDSSSMAPRHT